MTGQRSPPWEAVVRVFEQALALPDADRSAGLEALCDGDEALRGEVLSLLRSDESLPPTFLQESDLGSFLDRMPTRGEVGLHAGGRFAGYEILGLIGEGGMGAVYRARQLNPERDVALKVLPPSLASPDRRSRFDREVHVLGQLEHRGIARIHDAGVHDAVPYFAMELVRGRPLDEAAAGLDREARLGLVLAVCEAVQYAHERGVVHRDLKPANILVDGFGEPRVLDFGIARMQADELAPLTQATSTGQILGTLAYMSPEQARGDVGAIDARSDVYALGVLLYELLAGRRPFVIEGRGLVEAVRVVSEEEPTRLDLLDRALRGDLTTIVAKALEKDPARRYASARALADDLRRTLTHEPIEARPPSVTYQLRKFTRRHRALVVGALAVFFALTIGLVASVNYSLEADEQRAEAEDARSEAEQATLEARRNHYRGSLLAAMTALDSGDGALAAQLLDEAPEEWRGFEFRHVQARLDGSIAGLPGDWEPMAWLPDGETLVARGPSDLVLWRPDIDQEVARWNTDGPLVAAAVGDTLVAGATEERLSLWDLPTAALRWQADVPGPIRDVVLDPLADRVLVAAGTEVHALDTETGERTTLPSRWQGPAIRVPADAEDPDTRPDKREEVRGVRFSPDGRWLVILRRWDVALWDRRVEGLVRGWSLERKDSRHTWTCAFDEATGRLLLGAYFDGALHVLDTGGEAVERVLTSPEPPHERLGAWALDRDGRRLLLAGTVNEAWLYDADDLTPIEPLDGHPSALRTAAFAPVSGRLAAASRDHSVTIHDARGRVERALLGHAGRVDALAWNADGTRLATAAQEGQPMLRVWGLGDAAPEGTRVLASHTNWLYAVSFSPDGAWLASCGWDDTVRLWNIDSGESFAVIPFESTPRGATFSQDAGRLLVVTARRLVEVDLITGDVWRGERFPRGQGRMEAIAEAVTGRLANYGRTGALQPARELGLVLEEDGGRPLRVVTRGERQPVIVSRDNRPDVELSPPASEDTGPARGSVLSADGRLIATHGRGELIRVWDVATGALLATLRGHRSAVHGVAFSPDGSRLASGDDDGIVRLWSTDAFAPLAELRGHQAYVHSLAFSPDGRTLATASGDFTIRLWDTRPASELTRRAAAARAGHEAARARILQLLDACGGDARAVVERLAADQTLADGERRAARAELLAEVLRRRG